MDLKYCSYKNSEKIIKLDYRHIKKKELNKSSVLVSHLGDDYNYNERHIYFVRGCRV